MHIIVIDRHTYAEGLNRQKKWTNHSLTVEFRYNAVQ